MNTISHKGYSASIDCDDEEGLFFGRIAGIADAVGFHADNVAELKVVFQEAVDDYLETCVKIGKNAQKSNSDKDVLSYR